MKRKTTTKIIFAGLLLNTMALIGLGVSHTITISNLEKENTNNKETIQTLNAENEALKGQIETLTNKNTLTQKEIDELNEAVKKLNTKVDSLEELYNNFAYQVKKGDTLSEIVHKYYGNYSIKALKAIALINNISNVNVIEIDQTIYLPSTEKIKEMDNNGELKNINLTNWYKKPTTTKAKIQKTEAQKAEAKTQNKIVIEQSNQVTPTPVVEETKSEEVASKVQEVKAEETAPTPSPVAEEKIEVKVEEPTPVLIIEEKTPVTEEQISTPVAKDPAPEVKKETEEIKAEETAPTPAPVAEEKIEVKVKEPTPAPVAEEIKAEKVDTESLTEVENTTLEKVETKPLPEVKDTKTEKVEAEPLPEVKDTTLEKVEAEPLPEVKDTKTEKVEAEPLPEVKQPSQDEEIVTEIPSVIEKIDDQVIIHEDENSENTEPTINETKVTKEPAPAPIPASAVPEIKSEEPAPAQTTVIEEPTQAKTQVTEELAPTVAEEPKVENTTTETQNSEETTTTLDTEENDYEEALQEFQEAIGEENQKIKFDYIEKDMDDIFAEEKEAERMANIMQSGTPTSTVQDVKAEEPAPAPTAKEEPSANITVEKTDTNKSEIILSKDLDNSKFTEAYFKAFDLNLDLSVLKKFIENNPPKEINENAEPAPEKANSNSTVENQASKNQAPTTTVETLEKITSTKNSNKKKYWNDNIAEAITHSINKKNTILAKLGLEKIY